MTAEQMCDQDIQKIFNAKRTAAQAKPQPTVQMVPKARPKQEAEPKAEQEHKPKETSKPKKQESVQEVREPKSLRAFRILMTCMGIFFFHSIIQAAVVYMFTMGTLDSMGVIVGTMANAGAGGFRIGARFQKQ